MRSWLNHKKKSLGDRYEEQENSDETVSAELDDIYKKIITKGEFLVALKNPATKFYSEEPSPSHFSKKPSYLDKNKSAELASQHSKAEWKDSMQTW